MPHCTKGKAWANPSALQYLRGNPSLFLTQNVGETLYVVNS